MDLEEEVVRAHVETAHLVEAIAAHHQSDEAHTFTQHVNVMDDAINSWVGTEGGAHKDGFKLHANARENAKKVQNASSDKLTKLAVAVMLPLVLLFPAFAHAESVVREVRLCGGEKRRRRRREKDSQHQRESTRRRRQDPGVQLLKHTARVRLTSPTRPGISPHKRLESSGCN